MIYDALAEKRIVIDATPDITVIHQNHPDEEQKINRNDKASNENLDILGGFQNIRSILDAQYVLAGRQLVKKKIFLQVITAKSYCISYFEGILHSSVNTFIKS